MCLGPVLWALDSQMIKMVGVSASSWSAHKGTCWLPPGTKLLLWAWSSREPALGWEEAHQGAPGGQDLPLLTRDPGHLSLTSDPNKPPRVQHSRPQWLPWRKQHTEHALVQA